MTYLERNLLAQSYYYKIITADDGRLKDYYKKNIEIYDRHYAKMGHVNNVDLEIKKTKEALNYYLTEYSAWGFDKTSNYNNTDFIKEMVKLDSLEKVKSKQEEQQKEDLIRETFGGFNPYNESSILKRGVVGVKAIPKSSEELINERDERLAILYKLMDNKKINKSEFVKKKLLL